jgi:hypothetical protein
MSTHAVDMTCCSSDKDQLTLASIRPMPSWRVSSFICERGDLISKSMFSTDVRLSNMTGIGSARSAGSELSNVHWPTGSPFAATLTICCLSAPPINAIAWIRRGQIEGWRILDDQAQTRTCTVSPNSPSFRR